MKLGKDIWVIVEHARGQLTKVSLGLISEGRRLVSKLGGALCVVLIGYQIEDLIDTVSHYGAQRVFLVQDSIYEYYDAQVYSYILAALITEYCPSIVLLAGTSRGKDLASRLAAKLQVGLASDCANWKTNHEGSLEYIRPVYGGKVYATEVNPVSPVQIFSMQPKVLDIEELATNTNPEIISISKPEDSPVPRTKVLDFLPADPATVDLTEAEIIVAGGRGVGSAENFSLLKELADLIGGSLGGSRVAVDYGWMSSERQIGQTGKIVAPKLYIACGISGAIQHQMGIKDSEKIIAINTDKNAPIFKLADVKIVGDLREVIPAICRRLRREKNETT
jgi:electron transfer flavoprotein alpha subunit